MPTASERFESRLDKGGPCWPWKGFCVSTGYGRFWANGKMWRAHRFAYEHFVGPIGDLCVLHRCDNPPCCNPAHLWLGTPLDNALDRAQKGRSGKDKRSGARSVAAKLTIDQVRHIRQSDEPPNTLAARYGVGLGTILNVRNNKTWIGA